jgi:hypothetical protein
MTTPSWMRAPPESFSPMIGAPALTARSITLQTFSPNGPDKEPPNTVKSWLNKNTVRPSMVPWPVTTPSPGIFFFHAKVMAAVDHIAVQLLERSRVQQGDSPLARGHLALVMLLLDAYFASTQFSRFIAFIQFGKFILGSGSLGWHGFLLIVNVLAGNAFNALTAQWFGFVLP